MNQYRLLLVDDYASLLAPMTFFFEEQGFAISLAYNGVQAVERAASVDAIFMDTEMPPGIFGFEACRQIRSKPFGKRLVIIGASGREGYTNEKKKFIDYRTEWLNAGADAFFLKDDVMSMAGYVKINNMILDYFAAKNSRA